MAENNHDSSPSSDSSFRVLVVDDDKVLRDVLVRCLRSKDRQIWSARDGIEAVELITRQPVDLVFLDINMPGPDGIKTLKEIKRLDRDTTVVMMTGYGSIEYAVDAMKGGAEDFVMKPGVSDKAVELARRVERQKKPRRLLSERRWESVSGHGSSRFISEDPAMEKTLELIERIAPLPSTVLIEGESGTGKELIARTLHESGPRSKRRFVAFNCAAIPEQLLESELFGHEEGSFTGASARKTGYFEAAQGGTIFLDEIGEMSVDLQTKLLRVIQERSFRRVGGIEEIPTDVRIIAATNQDLEKQAAAGHFRKDLFYRINVVRVIVPPLRERPKDIPLLGQYFLEKYAEEFGRPVRGLSLEVIDRFIQYQWEGNVRELQNVIERAVAVTTGDQIEVADLPERFQSDEFPLRARADFKPYQEAKSDFELDYVIQAMKEADGNIARASRLAGVSRQNLYEKLARYGIEQSRFRRGEGGEVA